MEYQNITNLLDNIPNTLPKFITKKWIDGHDLEKHTILTNK